MASGALLEDEDEAEDAADEKVEYNPEAVL